MGQPTSLSLYLTDQVPDNPEVLKPVAQLADSGPSASVDLDNAPTGRYLTVWLTALPPVAGGFKGGVADLVVAEARHEPLPDAATIERRSRGSLA